MANIWILIESHNKVAKVKPINSTGISRYEATFITPIMGTNLVGKDEDEEIYKVTIVQDAIKRRFGNMKEAYLFHNTNSNVYD